MIFNPRNIPFQYLNGTYPQGQRFVLKQARNKGLSHDYAIIYLPCKKFLLFTLNQKMGRSQDSFNKKEREKNLGKRIIKN